MISRTSAPASRLSQSPQLGQNLVETLPGNELHDVVVQAIVFPDAEDGHDIGMVQPGGGLRFAPKAQQALRVELRLARQDLQSHMPAQRFLFGLVDDAHPAPAGLAQDAIIPKPL